MPALLLPLAGFAFLDSLNLLNLGVTTAVVYDSRLSRRSPLPAGLNPNSAESPSPMPISCENA